MAIQPQNPGGVISAALGGAEGGENMLQKLINGAGKMDISSMLGKGFDGMKNLFTNFFQKIMDFFKGDMHVLGNDKSQVMVRDMAQMTGTNPNITEVSPNGATRDLGRAADIGRTAEFDPQGMDRKPIAQPKASTPGFTGPGLNMGGPS